MLPIVLACLIWLPALIGLGLPLATALRRSCGAIFGSVALRTAIAGLLGMFVASTIAMTANFFVAVSPWVSSALLFTGWIILIRRRTGRHRLPAGCWWLFAGIVLLIALIDARGLDGYDTGLYHLPAVQWITAGPLPLGLANLHDLLGFNCSWFDFAAAVETPLARGKSCFIVNALLAILIALPATDALLRKPITPSRFLLGMMLIPLALFGIDLGMISSLSPDLIIMLLTIFSVALWIQSDRFVPYLLTFACFAVTIKLSAIPLLLIALIFTVITGRWPGIKLIAFCVIAGFISLLHGIWLSGYPAFPSTIGRLSQFTWTVPFSVASHATHEIVSWARYQKTYETVSPGTPWLKGWIQRVALSGPMRIAYGFFLIGIGLWLYHRPRRSPTFHRGAIAWLAMLSATIFWFITAPDVRFGFGCILSIACLPIAVWLEGRISPVIIKRHRRTPAAIGVVILLFCSRIDRHLFKAALLHWPTIPTAKLATRRTIDGTIIWKPIGNDRTWNAPLPATSELDPRLRCDRDPDGKIRRFRIE